MPQENQIKGIQELRHRFDPLASKIPPHVTLVFPFISDLSIETLKTHIDSCVSSFMARDFSLGGLDLQNGYAWYPVISAKEGISRFHNRLYSGILKNYKSKNHPYTPHVTVGRYSNGNEAQTISEAEKSMQVKGPYRFEKLVLESIDSSGLGYPEYQIVF